MFKVKDKESLPICSYNMEYRGIEEIYIIKSDKKTHILTSRLALGGKWINFDELEDILKTVGLKLKSGDKILVESYKLRSLNKEGGTSGRTPDCSWSIEVE